MRHSRKRYTSSTRDGTDGEHDVLGNGSDQTERETGPQPFQANSPYWMMSCLQRWSRLYHIALEMSNVGPICPVLSPPAMETALTISTSDIDGVSFDALRALGDKVLRLLIAMHEHCMQPDTFQLQLAQRIDKTLPKDGLEAIRPSRLGRPARIFG